MNSNPKYSFKIRPVERRDFAPLKGFIRDTRFEHFPEGFRVTIFYNVKLQSLLLLVSTLSAITLSLPLIWALFFYLCLLVLAYIFNYLEWKRKVRTMSSELDNWQDFHNMYLTRKGCCFLIATTQINNQEVFAGCVGLRMPSKELEFYVEKANLSENCFEVVRMGVDVKFRGRGLSKILMRELEDHFLNNFHFKKFDFVLECSEVQYVALKMYRKIGYYELDVEYIKVLLGLVILTVYVYAKKFR